MGHHHHHHEHSHCESSNFNSSFMIAIVVNICFVIVQVVFALHAHSMSLLGEAGHNFGDVLGLALAWVANRLLSKRFHERYSYGFKKSTILAALINSLILVITATLLGYESINRLMNPAPVDELTVIVVASLGILVNGGTAVLFMKGRHHDLNIRGAFLHLAYDAVISLGVVLTAVLILFTGKLWLDPLVGLLLVATIVFGTWELLRDSVNMLLDAIPHHINRHAVIDYLHHIPGVTAIHDLHIWGLSSRESALTAHLVMPDVKLSDEDFARINQEMHAKFLIDHITLQIEHGDQSYPCSQFESC